MFFSFPVSLDKMLCKKVSDSATISQYSTISFKARLETPPHHADLGRSLYLDHSKRDATYVENVSTTLGVRMVMVTMY